MCAGNCRSRERREQRSHAGFLPGNSAWNQLLITKQSRPQHHSCPCLIPEGITHASLQAGWRENNRLVLVQRDVTDTIKIPGVPHPGWAWTWSFLWLDQFGKTENLFQVLCVCSSCMDGSWALLSFGFQGTQLQAALAAKWRGLCVFSALSKNNNSKGGREASPAQCNKKSAFAKESILTSTLYLCWMLQKAVRLVFFIYSIMFKPPEQAQVLCEVTQIKLDHWHGRCKKHPTGTFCGRCFIYRWAWLGRTSAESSHLAIKNITIFKMCSSPFLNSANPIDRSRINNLT